jgi:hypothetical protein
MEETAEATAEVTALGGEQQGEMEPPQPQVPTARKFACKLCRCVLFTTEELAAHEPERHQISTRRVRFAPSCITRPRVLSVRWTNARCGSRGSRT